MTITAVTATREDREMGPLWPILTLSERAPLLPCSSRLLARSSNVTTIPRRANWRRSKNRAMTGLPNFGSKSSAPVAIWPPYNSRSMSAPPRLNGYRRQGKRRIDGYPVRLPRSVNERITLRTEQPMEQSPPEIDGLPILDEQAQQTVDKLDHIIEMAEERSRENLHVRREMTYIRRTLDKIVDRMVQAPNPILGEPPKAPTGTRTKRGRL